MRIGSASISSSGWPIWRTTASPLQPPTPPYNPLHPLTRWRTWRTTKPNHNPTPTPTPNPDPNPNQVADMEDDFQRLWGELARTEATLVADVGEMLELRKQDALRKQGVLHREWHEKVFDPIQPWP